MKVPILAVLIITMLLASPLATASAAAQDAAVARDTEATDGSTESEHEQLRALREKLTEAVLSNDVSAQLQYVHDDVVTTWQNNRVARGHEGLKEFLNEMNSGEERVFQGYTVPPSSDDISILYEGNTAIAFGSSVPHYKYMGQEFDLENRWTATLVKQDDGWKIAAYHVSADISDNPLLDAAVNSLMWAAVISLLIGLLIGIVGTKLLSKKRQPVA